MKLSLRDLIFHIPFISALTLMPSLESGASIQSNILVIFTVYNIATSNKSNWLCYFTKTNLWKLIFLACILQYIAISYISLIIHGDDWGMIRSLIIVTLYVISIDTRKIRKDIIDLSAIVGAGLLAFIAIYEYSHGVTRVGSYLNEIIFAQVSLMILIINLSSLMDTEQRIQKSLQFISIILTTLAIILSGTRGVWISLPIVFLIYIILYITKKHVKYSLALLLIPALMSAISYPYISQRFSEAKSNIIQAENGNHHSSIGGRLYIWHASLLMFKDSPIFGIGNDNFKKFEHNLIKSGTLEKPVENFAHSHNEFIYSMAIKGVIGLFSYIVFISVPIISSLILRRLDITALTITISTSISALTDVPLKHSINIYIFVLVSFYFLASQRKKNENQNFSN